MHPPSRHSPQPGLVLGPPARARAATRGAGSEGRRGDAQVAACARRVGGLITQTRIIPIMKLCSAVALALISVTAVGQINLTQGRPLGVGGSGVLASSPQLWDCSQFTGTLDFQLNTCNALAITSNGGVIDARGLGGPSLPSATRSTSVSCSRLLSAPVPLDRSREPALTNWFTHSLRRRRPRRRKNRQSQSPGRNRFRWRPRHTMAAQDRTPCTCAARAVRPPGQKISASRLRT